MKVMIATPAHAGKVNVGYAMSLSYSTIELLRNNIEFDYFIKPSGSLLVAERNSIIKKFIESDCDFIMLIDADISWPQEAIVRLLSYNKDFISVCYPARGMESFIFRPITKENGSMDYDESNGLLKMDYVPSGFMLISKEGIEKMCEFHSKDYYKNLDVNKNIDDGYALFNTEVYNGEFWGEDYVFCRKAREAGLDIWVDPFIPLNHDGITRALVEILENKDNVEQPI